MASSCPSRSPTRPIRTNASAWETIAESVSWRMVWLRTRSPSSTRVLKAAIAAGRLMVRAATWSCRAGRPFIAASSVSMARACGADALFMVAPDIRAPRKAVASWPTCCSTAVSLAWFSGVGAAR